MNFRINSNELETQGFNMSFYMFDLEGSADFVVLKYMRSSFGHDQISMSVMKGSI